VGQSHILGNGCPGKNKVEKTMSTQQPEWKLIANLGDVHPVDHGGYFVYEDQTGVYPPEAELLISPDTDEGNWIVYRFILEPCTFTNGILSDNKYHPDHKAWFADSLQSIASFVDRSVDGLITSLTHGDVVDRAMAWREIGEYHGFENLDSYPLTFTDRAEVEKRYSNKAL